ncbi:hypothetical protein [Laceyella tengchongensis]
MKRKIVNWLVLCVMILLVGCGDKLSGKEAPVLEIQVKNEKVHFEGKTICWNRACPGDLTFLPPSDKSTIKVKPDEAITIKFSKNPQPSSINMFQGNLGEVKKLDNESVLNAPSQKGTYDYNIVSYWNRNKGQTWGIAQYSFRIIVE